MKVLYLFFVSTFLLFFSCGNPVKVSEIKSIIENETTVDFEEEEIASFFKAVTIKNDSLNSEDLLGKNIVLLIGKADFEGAMSESMNELFDRYKQDTSRIAFVCIIDGSFDITKEELAGFIEMYNQDIIFIDNTVVNREKKQINHSIHCWPANILIDKAGKVLYNTCGGYGFSDEYEYKLDSLMNATKS